jgi:murein DD-endopeptidase MepM/ murein hydrolase activator NlpD
MMVMMQMRLRPLAAAIATVGVLGAGTMSAFTGAGASGRSYTVRTGDTASGIASRFGVSVGALVSANHLADANRILIGQHLVIPSGSFAGPVSGPASFPRRLLAHPERLALLPSFRHWAPASIVPTGLLEAMAWMESGWQRDVVSSTGAIGVGQLEPSTVPFVCRQILGLGYNLNPRDPDANIRMSAAYLGLLIRQTGGDVSMALGSYYQGLASMRSRGPLLMTRIYISDVRGLWSMFGAG